MIKVLIVLFVLIFLAQIIRVFEISSNIGKNKNEVTDSSNNINGIFLLIAGIVLLVFFFWQRAEWMHLTLQTPASEHGVIIDKLWDTTMGLIMFVFLLLTPMLFGIAYYFSCLLYTSDAADE